MRQSALPTAALRRPHHSFDPYRNMECAREALFDAVHDLRGNAPAVPPITLIKPRRAGWLSMLISKIGG